LMILKPNIVVKIWVLPSVLTVILSAFSEKL